VWLSGGASTFAQIDVADCQLEAGDVLTAFAPRADELLPGVVGTTEIAPNSATQIYTSSLTGPVNNYNDI